MDEDKAHEILSWLNKASSDVRAAERLLDDPEPLCNASGFHSQQAAEKVLKGYLTWRDQLFEKTHSLVALVAKCLPCDPSFAALRDAATTLTPYAVETRYPGDLAELTEKEAVTALVLARRVWVFFLGRLPAQICDRVS